MGRGGVKNPKYQRIIGKTAAEIRTDTRDYIKNERDTILQRWRALEESCKSEDRQRIISNDENHKSKVHYTPLSILKFIGTLRKAVKLKVMYQGGTTYSIIRELFLYWDKDKSNEISAQELKMCMDSLGVKMTAQDREEIIAYYDSGKGTKEMNYLKLMKDITRGEPSVVEFIEKELPDAVAECRFEEIEDSHQEKPPIVEQYVFALHQHVYKEISAPGALGTPVEHGKKVYSMYFGIGMTPMQLIHISRKNMGLMVKLEHAKQIVSFYDRKNTGKMDYTQLVLDACQSMMTMISYIEPTDSSRLEEKKLLKSNPYIPRPFVAPQNKKLEQVKRHLKMSLNAKMSEIGGTTKSILVDHFKLYDQHNDGKIHSYLHLQAIAKNIGATLTKDDSLSLMNCYDRDHTGSMLYTLFIKDLTHEDRHFLHNAQDVLNFSSTATSRTPQSVSKIVENFRSVAEAYARKSAGKYIKYI
jgi:Ca2+-binding EF-hand superfamily protein